MARVSGIGRFDPASESDPAPEQGSSGDLEQCRVAGEDAPIWLPTALALLGILFAVAAASSSLSPQALKQFVSRMIVTEPAAAPRQAADEALSAPPPIVEHPSPRAAPPAVNEEPERRAETTPSAAGQEASASVQTTPTEVPCLPVIGIPFARGSARPILAGTEQSIDVLVQWMTRHGDAILSVEGHADSTGTEQHNVLLSFRRAKAVIAWLAGSGVPERRMIARAAGASEAKGSPEDAATNRRALLHVEGVEACRDGGDTTERQ